MRASAFCLATMLLAGPGLAADVSFTGTLTGVCTLALPTPGILALSPEGDLTSAAGVPAVLTILSIGSNTVTVDAPEWVSTPTEYDETGETLEVAYAGVAGLEAVDQPYTGIQTDFGVSTLPLTALTINAQASNPNGFEAGTYQMRVTVTCAP